MVLIHLKEPSQVIFVKLVELRSCRQVHALVLGILGILGVIWQEYVMQFELDDI